jgi:hypothetical protein
LCNCRQNSGSQAKKHAESNGNGGGRVPELHRGKTDPEVVRQQRGEKRGSGCSPGASSNGLARKPDKNADRQKKMGELEATIVSNVLFVFSAFLVCQKKTKILL